MFLVIQFPFVDTRRFVNGQTGRLIRPDWPIPDVDKDFIRSSGLVRPRLRGGSAQWAGEEIYGEVSSALKFPDRLRQIAITANKVCGNIDFAFRRFYSDGIIARMEVGFKLDLRTSTSDPLLVSELIYQIAHLKVVVQDTNGTDKRCTTTNAIEAGNVLARHFLHATTNHKEVSDTNIEPWWFTASAPTLIVEHTESMQLPRHTRHILDVDGGGAALAHCWIRLGTRRVSTWFIINQHADSAAVRNLRIHLSRLHSEREGLRCVISQLNSRKLSPERDLPASDTLQRYFRNTLHVLQRPERFGHNQSLMLNAAQDAFRTALEGETASLEWMRRQVAEQLQGYIDRNRHVSTIINNNINGNYMATTIQMGNVSVTGDFNVVTAEHIRNSFNKAASTDACDELKEQLRELAVQVADLAKRLPPDQAELLSKDLETLTSEATSKSPRPRWLELSSEGLLEAAKTAGEMAVPIATAVKAVLALLSS